MEVIDLTYLNSVSDGNEELIKSLVEIFKGQLDEFKEEFNRLYEVEDWRAVSALAHKAKSSIISMGMSDLADAMKQLEMLCKYHCVTTQCVDSNVSEEFRRQIEMLPEPIKLWVYDNNSKKRIQDLIFFYILQSEKAKKDLQELGF